jgi:transcriptional regulator GlxA family with amidase domain
MYDIKRLQQEMVRQFLSVEKLARKAKVAPSTVHRIFECGYGNPGTIGKLAKALRLTSDDILEDQTA